MVTEVRPAASLILMRDRKGEAPEILVVQRGAKLAFAGGAYAFPGGRVDPADREFAVTMLPTLDVDEGAARITAIRETIEEVGMAPGFATTPDRATIERWRADGLETLPTEAGGLLDPDLLVPFARWVPPEQEALPRRFDTRFYLADASALPDQEPEADGEETMHAFWASAGAVLARCQAGEGRAIFPTRRMLERLGRFDSFAEAREEALRLPQRILTPWVELRHGHEWLCIPDDAGYPIAAELLETALRY